ncbi:MAG TPA: hypothetical protein VLE53_04470 [Gemmatimonadaceae bacterium]|nr:hypothetical protein [Gemmatimonadaceae bacterium]
MGAGAAAAAAIANAIKASGVVVRVAPADFIAVLKRADAPLVVVAKAGVFQKHYRYLTSYKGLAFFAKSDSPLVLPPRTEVIGAEKISIPDL